MIIDKIINKLKYFMRLFRNRIREILVFRKTRRSEVFSKIYQLNYWDDGESVSGYGSTFKYTESIRKELPALLRDYNVNSLLDAPCGDYNWMRYVIEDSSVSYIGADIVEDLIDRNNILYGSSHVRFTCLDIVTDELPECDLLICRDCLFHLPECDIKSFFVNFASQKIKYLLTTTHVNDSSFINTDIEVGRFRKIDLFSHPYNMPPDVLYRFDDYMQPEPRREMILIDKSIIVRMISTY